LVKRGIIISFFVFFVLPPALFSQVKENTRWYSLKDSPEMEALLVVELRPGGVCLTSHSYLRKGETLPFDRDRVRENWYYDGRDRLFLTDSWGEFASFTWDGEQTRLITVIGGEEIILIPLKDSRWEELESRFFPDGETGQ